MKLFYFYLETTGVLHWRNGIHQIAGIIEVDGEIKETFNFKVRPNPAATIDDKALEVGGVTKEQVLAYEPMENVYKQLTQLLGKYVNKYDKSDKFYLVGFNNARFDDAFFKAFFVQNKDNYFNSWFWIESIDVMVLAAEKLRPIRKTMPNFKLSTVAKFMGIDVSEKKLHEASYDIELTYLIYQKLMYDRDNKRDEKKQE